MLSSALLIVAFILFLLAALPIQVPGNMIAAGLACYILSLIIASGIIHR